LIAVEIVRKKLDQVCFAISPRRRAGKRFPALRGRNCGVANNFEATVDSAHAFLPYATPSCSSCGAPKGFMAFEADSKIAIVREAAATVGILRNFRHHVRCLEARVIRRDSSAIA
jgi:hypothetical protein